MPDTNRFDPLGWFISASLTMLIGAVALVVAIHLIATIWIWLVGILGAVTAIGLAVIIVLAWQRRQPW